MLLRVPEVLSPAELARCRAIVEGADWADGKITAGTQSEQVKNNRQLPEDAPASHAARAVVLDALGRSALFITGALPKKTYPPLFNRYDGASNAFGNHVDNSVRTSPVTGAWVRTDLSATLFLSEPAEYDGGELVIEDTFGSQSVKLAAGDLILYPASSVHRVEPVTRGCRLAAFFWVESMVRDDAQRRLLFDLDMSILALRGTDGDTPPVVKLTGCYHNLLRMWADT
ncbi:Fe2+-dependent dioxygenase [Noviherbaspirillum suwonense]|uniref:PKHD-type hydroxylase n=1 Tax=Noviherbaspirillum suwonense TaxID=1224511 RepID=A0ABY1QDK6_9BURK|nr:Fe2+-dependent dioxygenase [Noviherbaspirillum suwonense]SMP67804.1 PKHD-type hydroxylase [Noviherbaspirillum suwonense]